MNQIILASHGGLAAGAKDTLEMVLGDVSNVHVVSLARDDKEPITNKVDAMIATFNADDTVYVLTDMLGSSVNNSMVELSKNGTKFTVVSGFNIPLALTLAMSPVPVKGAELAALINEARVHLGEGTDQSQRTGRGCRGSRQEGQGVPSQLRSRQDRPRTS